MKKLITLFITSLAIHTNAKEITLTFDDAPQGDGQIFTASERADQFIATLKKHGIQAAFFVNSDHFKHTNRRTQITKYDEAGHIIANHGHQHLNFHQVSILDYITDIRQAHLELISFKNFKRWYRYPYLNEGNTIEKRDAVRNYLKNSGYINAYVTVDNYDWYMNLIVQNALKEKRKVNLSKACKAFADILWDDIGFFDNLAQEHLGGAKHVMLLHDQDLTALCLGSLIKRIKDEGWKIIAPEKAFNEPKLVREPDTLYLGQGRISAYVHEMTGEKHFGLWNDEQKLDVEFDRRRVVE